MSNDLDARTARVYTAGAGVRRAFRAALESCRMTAEAAGETLQWSEQKGWFESSFSVHCARRRHIQIADWVRSFES